MTQRYRPKLQTLGQGLVAAAAVAGSAWGAALGTEPTGAACGVYTGVGSAGSATAEQVVALARGTRQPAGGGWQTPLDRQRPAGVEVAVFGLG